MAHTIVSTRYPPHIDTTKTPLAYGHRALPRLNEELNNENLLTRQRAVMALCDHLHDPEHVAAALREGIAKSLKSLLSDADVTVREKSTECLFVIAGHSIGRDTFLEEEIIVPLSKLFDDSEDIVRKNAHNAMKMASETPTGAQGIVEANLIASLVEKLKTELDEIKDIILDTLHFCMNVDASQALENDAMTVFADLLQHESAEIRAKAARDIMDLSVPLEGKDKAVEVKCVPLLVDQLQDEKAELRANAAGAIMMIAITTKGKYTALEAEAVDALALLVDDEISEVRLNAIKALTCISEAPEGRKQLKQHVDKIKEHGNDSVPAVARASETAVKVISWTP